MLRTGRYLYVLFCCQQAAEKKLKALIVQETHRLPPRSHDLALLISRTPANPSESQMLLLKKLAHYYIETRYPQELGGMADEVDAQSATKYLEETREFLAWLDHWLKSV